ncbi:Tn3 family transposase [Spirillospora sp. NPDC052269]
MTHGWSSLLADYVIYSTARDITDVANAIAAEGRAVDPDNLATISPYTTRIIRRFGNWILNLSPTDRYPDHPARSRVPCPVRPMIDELGCRRGGRAQRSAVRLLGRSSGPSGANLSQCPACRGRRWLSR